MTMQTEIICSVCGGDSLERNKNDMLTCLGCQSEFKPYARPGSGKMIEIGIDPGASGGIAVRDEKGAVTAFPMPRTEGDICSNLWTIRQVANVAEVPAVAYVEDLPYFTGKNLPGSSIGKMFRNFGFILGCLQSLSFEVVMIKPQRWQKLLALGTKGSSTTTEWKNKLKADAQRRFPQLGAGVTLKTADALLILEAGDRV